MYMKKITLSLFILLVTSCVDLTSDDSPTTSFYVKNTSNKTITFTASVMKFSQITDPYTVTISFDVNPNDSVLARKTGFKKDGTAPQSWFESFVITQVEGIEMNNPELSENWVKYNIDKIPTYVFTLNKKIQ